MSSDLFIIGASGTKAYRASMAAISENITNATTENYSRRTVSLRESALSSATMVTYKGQTSFGGVEVAGVNRANDPYLDASARLTGQELGSANARLRWMTDIETSLNDDDQGVGHLISDMHGAITQLAANPSDPSLRSNVMFSIEQVVSAFNRSADDLSYVAKGISDSAGREVSTLNDSMAELARVNANLLRAQPGTSNMAQLLDTRDAALAKITQRLDATVTFGPNGTASVTYDGQTLVQGDTAGSITVATDTDGTLDLSFNGTAVANPGSGSLGGLFTSATVTRDRRATLDTLANQFATTLNDWNAAGINDANTSGVALVSGTTAATLAQATTAISAIAAKSSDGRINGNLIDAANVLRGNGSVEQGWTALVTSHANLLATTTAEQSTTEARNTQARSARDEVSGVDLDMEAADLLRFQQAYSGCAKIIQVARDCVDAILNIM